MWRPCWAPSCFSEAVWCWLWNRYFKPVSKGRIWRRPQILKQQEKNESSSRILRREARTKTNARDAAEPTISGRSQLQGFGQRCSVTGQHQSAVLTEPRVSSVAREHDRGHLTGEISSQNMNKDILSPCDAPAFICIIRSTAYYM